jgi:hypothetical protein
MALRWAIEALVCRPGDVGLPRRSLLNPLKGAALDYVQSEQLDFAGGTGNPVYDRFRLLSGQ